MVIGIANYQKARKLPSTVLDDARDVAELLKDVNYCGYLPTNVELLLDSQATLDGIRKALGRLAQAAAPDETVVVYFSGHGGRIAVGEYLIPIDCDPNDLPNTALSSTELTNTLMGVKADRLVVLLDACHSAGAAELKEIDPADGIKGGLSEEAYNQFAHGKGRVMMASCRATETSVVLRNMKNSLFTHHLLDALRGKASAGKLIRVFEVFHHVSEKVPAQEKTQHPVFKAYDLENNFPLALCQGGKGASNPAPVTSARRLGAFGGKAKIAICDRLLDRWQKLATYLEIPLPDQAKFMKGNEPQQILDWLEQRARLADLRDAFNYLGWDDLIGELDRHPQ